MPSLGSTLQIAKTGLIASQQGMNVTSHNIANATTEGYSRQRLLLTGNPALNLPGGVYGSGVSVADVMQVADPLLDRAWHDELAGMGREETRAAVLSRVEGLLGEPSDSSLGASLDAFFSAWSDLATHPGDPSVRTSVRHAAQNLTDRVHALAAGIDSLRQESEARLSAGMAHVNTLLGKIADLNREIAAVELDGTTAGDLRDARSRSLAELAELIPIQVTNRESGTVGVTSSGVSIVDGVDAHTLELRSSSGVWSLGVVGGTRTIGTDGGVIGGLLEGINTDLPEFRQQLDDLVSALVTEVNAVHETGTGPAGTTGISFFDPTGLSASSIALSADVLADADAIAAGTPDGLGAYRAGADDVALAIAGLREADIASLGTSAGEHYRGLVLDVGNRVRSATDAAQAHTTLAEQAQVRRMSLSGVSVDEELVKLIEFQSAYQASARVITAAEEMMQTLISM